jgi:thiamine-phosphate pyrophosphorylase
VSPIFPSISKPGYEKAFDFDFLKTKLSDNKLCNKVFALGGIVPDRIQTCHQLGFHGVAVLGYFWEPLVNGKEDLAFERFRKLNVACRYFSKKKECKKK